MADTVLPTPESLLRQCASAAPSPWFPSEFAETTGVPRDSLDGILNTLRVAGLINIADWVKGRGQGYSLTDAGREVLRSPSLLTKLNVGKRLSISDRLNVEEIPAPQRRDDGSATAYERGEVVRDSLLHPKRLEATPWLIVLNLTVFVVSLGIAIFRQLPTHLFLYHSDPRILIETGAVSGSLLLQGDWWRLVTCCFVHIGLLHLCVNLYSLWALGPQTEQAWGKTRFTVIYLFAGIGGSWAAMMTNPNTMLAGASGAIWGVQTSLMTWLVLNRAHIPQDIISRSLRVLFIILFLNIGVSFIPGISMAGHFGGGIVGVVVSILLNIQRFGSARQRAVVVAVLACFPAIAVVALLNAMERDPRWGGIAQVNEIREKRRNLQEFQQAVVPIIRQIQREYTRIAEGWVDVLLNQPLANRDKMKVLEAIRQIDQLRAHMVEETEQLDLDEEVKLAPLVQKTDQYLNSTYELLGEMSHRLNEGLDAEDKKLRELRRDVKRFFTEWEQLLRK